MQITGGYSAAGSINAIEPAQQTRRRAARSSARGGDTVAISDEALALFRQSLTDAGADTDAHTAAKFRHALEEAWNDAAGGEESLLAKIRSALSAWKS